jgi:hypothetical protein
MKTCAELFSERGIFQKKFVEKIKTHILYFYCCTVHFISIYQEKPTNALKKYFKNTH